VEGVIDGDVVGFLKIVGGSVTEGIDDADGDVDGINELEGFTVGNEVGKFEGFSKGASVGCPEGDAAGLRVGILEGPDVGAIVGSSL